MDNRTPLSLNSTEGQAGTQPSVGPPQNDERADIDALFRRLIMLEERATEVDKPWYRVPSTILPIIISIGALVASIAIPIEQARQAAKEASHTKFVTSVETLNTLVGQIIDLRETNTEKLASVSNIATYETESQLLNVKKAQLQDRAMQLLAILRSGRRSIPELCRL